MATIEQALLCCLLLEILRSLSSAQPEQYYPATSPTTTTTIFSQLAASELNDIFATAAIDTNTSFRRIQLSSTSYLSLFVSLATFLDNTMNSSSGVAHIALELPFLNLDCTEAIDLFATASASQTSTMLVSHRFFDCYDYVAQSLTYSNNNATTTTVTTSLAEIQLVSLGPSAEQLKLALATLLDEFSMRRYGVIFGDELSEGTVYSKLTSSIVFKLATNTSYTCSFSVPLSDSKLVQYIQSGTKCIYTSSSYYFI